MKNRNLIIGGVVVLLILVIGGYFLFFSNNTQDQTANNEIEDIMEEEILEISPDELGLTLTAGPNNNTVIFEVSNLEELSEIDYELSYLAEGDIPRGIVGSIKIDGTESIIEKELVLGTCSDVCHYDEDVSDINLVLKVTKTDGNVYHAEMPLEI